MSLFSLRGELSKRQSLLLGIFGALVLIGVWFLITVGKNPVFPGYILPNPVKVLSSYGSLYTDNDIIRNTCLSLGLNLSGYIEAILISLPLGFVIGIYPFFRGAFQKQVDAVRYIPLTAVTGLFIVWFGTATSMKVHFLAFGIIIYLLPVVLVRIREVNDVYLKTVYTLGATDWQTIRTVYIPSVLSRIMDDIRVLTAISWTYIIVAEGIGATGGIGALIWRAGIRQGRVDKVFAMLIIIVLIGVIQDRIFVYLDRRFFPHKYQVKDAYRKHKKETTSVSLIWNFIRSIGIWILIGLYAILLVDSFVPVLGSDKILPYFFGDTAYSIHAVMWSVIAYSGWKWYQKRRDLLPTMNAKVNHEA